MESEVSLWILGNLMTTSKNRKPKYFNCNKYEHMAKKCQLKKKEDK